MRHLIRLMTIKSCRYHDQLRLECFKAWQPGLRNSTPESGTIGQRG